jgi:hypothetical protein
MKLQAGCSNAPCVACTQVYENASDKPFLVVTSTLTRKGPGTSSECLRDVVLTSSECLGDVVLTSSE